MSPDCLESAQAPAQTMRQNGYNIRPPMADGSGDLRAGHRTEGH